MDEKHSLRHPLHDRRHVDAAHMYETEADVGAAVKASGVPREDERLTFVRTTQNFNIFSWSV